MIEARQLEGGDINPVVRVTIGNSRKKTRVQEMTNRPFYNQVTACTVTFNWTVYASAMIETSDVVLVRSSCSDCCLLYQVTTEIRNFTILLRITNFTCIFFRLSLSTLHPRLFGTFVENKS